MFALTPRLTLRPGWPEDAPKLAEAIGHEAVVRNLSRAPWPYTLRDAETFLALPRGAHDPCFLICERFGEHRLIGGIALVEDVPGCHEIGYWLTPDAWGLGYATEAAQAVVGIARNALRRPVLHGRYLVDNPASGGVLHKLGFRETGRGELFSLARRAAAPCVELTLDLGEAIDMPMPVAA